MIVRNGVGFENVDAFAAEERGIAVCNVPDYGTEEQVFGIVGCGRIAAVVALRVIAFGYDVRFYDPYVPARYEKALATGRVRALEELLASSDVVSLHVPLNGETRHMIDTSQFMAMKPTAHLVNTARGALVRYAPLEQALFFQTLQQIAQGKAVVVEGGIAGPPC